MHLNPKDRIICDQLVNNKVWEPFETTLIMNEVKEGEVVLDIGANIGYYTLILSKLVGEGGKVFAFEPDPDNFALLKKNVTVNGLRNVILVKKAISNKSGTLRLYLSEENKGDHRIYDSCDGRRSVPIHCIRLDDYFRDYTGQIDFIKMDIQGAEAGAIQGMSSLLEKNSRLRILTEFWPGGLKQFGIGSEEYLALLAKYGFRFYRIIDDQERIQPTTIRELSETRWGDEKFTNLFCTRETGFSIHLENWTKPSPWWERVQKATEELAELIPPRNTVILVDQNQWGTGGIVAGRRCLPFLERDGQYWGPPPDDGTAIREFERLRRSGAHFMVFAWPAFWWLEYYVGLHRHLRARFRCLLENAELVVFDLRTTTGDPSKSPDA